MKIFGREPAALVGVLQAILVGVGLWLGWSSEQIGALAVVLVVLGDLYASWRTRDTFLGLLVGVAKAVIAAIVAFGLNVSPEATAAILGIVTTLAGFFQRTQTGPALKPSLNINQTSTNVQPVRVVDDYRPMHIQE